MHVRSLTPLFVTVTIHAARIACPLAAQSTRDSAGVRLVENARPAWTPREQVSLGPTPRLVIGDTADAPTRFRQIRGVVRLPDGRIVVADGGSLQLRLFDAEGRFVSASAGRGDAPGQLQSMSMVRRLRGDTIAIGTGFSTLSLYTSTGQFVGTTGAASVASATSARRSLVVAVLHTGLRVVAPLPNQSPRAVGSRWVDSLAVQMVNASDGVTRDLGPLPYLEFAQRSTGPMPPWLSPIGVFAADDTHFYAGFGDRYAIRVYASDGRVQSIMRRARTPTRVSPEHWESGSSSGPSAGSTPPARIASATSTRCAISPMPRRSRRSRNSSSIAPGACGYATRTGRTRSLPGRSLICR